MSDRRLKPCADCGHGKTKHRAVGCIQTWRATGQTFMGVRTITKWCLCHGYRAREAGR